MVGVAALEGLVGEECGVDAAVDDGRAAFFGELCRPGIRAGRLPVWTLMPTTSPDWMVFGGRSVLSIHRPGWGRRRSGAWRRRGRRAIGGVMTAVPKAFIAGVNQVDGHCVLRLRGIHTGDPRGPEEPVISDEREGPQLLKPAADHAAGNGTIIIPSFCGLCRVSDLIARKAGIWGVGKTVREGASGGSESKAGAWWLKGSSGVGGMEGVGVPSTSSLALPPPANKFVRRGPRGLRVTSLRMTEF